MKLGDLVYDNVYTLVIRNVGNIPHPVRLFNANITADATNYGNPPSVSVVCLESSYAELLAETQTDGFETVGISLTNDGVIPSQLNQIIQVVKESAAGVDCIHMLQPANYFNVNQQQEFVREIFPYKMEIYGQTGLILNMLGHIFHHGTNILRMTIYVKKKISRTNLLSKRPLIIEIPDMLVNLDSGYVLK